MPALEFGAWGAVKINNSIRLFGERVIPAFDAPSGPVVPVSTVAARRGPSNQQGPWAGS